MRQRSRDPRRGQALGEYVVLVALIGVCLILVLGMLGKSAGRAYKQSSASLDAVPSFGSRGGGRVIGGGGTGGGGGAVLVGSSGGGGGGVHVPPASSSDSAGSGDGDPTIPAGPSKEQPAAR